MEEQNFILEHWKKERQSFHKNLDNLRKRINVKGIHDIRVNIKKMKAYRKLYYLLDNPESKIKFTETNKLFDTCGKLRNIHICLDLIDHYEKENESTYNELRDFLDRKSKQARAWTKQALKKYNDKDISAFELLLQSIQIQHQETRIKEQISTNLNKLLPLFQQPHRLRILLKKTYYWIKILSDKRFEQENEIEKLNNVLDKLGEWQDNEILLEEIKYFRNNCLPQSFEEYKKLNSLKKNIPGKKKQLRDEGLFLLQTHQENLHRP